MIVKLTHNFRTYW